MHVEMAFQLNLYRQLWPTTKSRRQKIHVKRWQFRWPCKYGSAMRGALPDGAHPWLHAKPLDAAIGQVPCHIAPAATMVDNFEWNTKNTNKTQLLSSFFTVDQRKKDKLFWHPKRTLYSRHRCDKLRTNVKHR